MTHTPGEWTYDDHGDGNKQLPIRAGGKIIAAIRDHGKLDDARLIIAAPELLTVVKWLLPIIEKLVGRPDFSARVGMGTPAHDRLDEARKLIAKAEPA